MNATVILKAETALWTGGNRGVESCPLIKLQSWPSRPIGQYTMLFLVPSVRRIPP